MSRSKVKHKSAGSGSSGLPSSVNSPLRATFNFRSQNSGSLGRQSSVSRPGKSFVDVVKSSTAPSLVPVSSVFKRINSDLSSKAVPSYVSHPARISVFECLDGSPRISGRQDQFSFSHRNHRPEITCFNCLAIGHFARDCSNDIRCLFCFGYGHTQRF